MVIYHLHTDFDDYGYFLNKETVENLIEDEKKDLLNYNIDLWYTTEFFIDEVEVNEE